MRNVHFHQSPVNVQELVIIQNLDYYTPNAHTNTQTHESRILNIFDFNY